MATSKSNDRFHAALDRIFQKYGKASSGVSDVIDLNRGEIVVDNGHLRSLRDASVDSTGTTDSQSIQTDHSDHRNDDYDSLGSINDDHGERDDRDRDHQHYDDGARSTRSSRRLKRERSPIRSPHFQDNRRYRDRQIDRMTSIDSSLEKLHRRADGDRDAASGLNGRADVMGNSNIDVGREVAVAQAEEKHVLKFEEEQLRASISALKQEREFLIQQQARLAIDVSFLETTLQARKEELRAITDHHRQCFLSEPLPSTRSGDMSPEPQNTSNTVRRGPGRWPKGTTKSMYPEGATSGVGLPPNFRPNTANVHQTRAQKKTGRGPGRWPKGTTKDMYPERATSGPGLPPMRDTRECRGEVIRAGNS